MKRGFLPVIICLCIMSVFVSCHKETPEEKEERLQVIPWTKPEPPPGDHISQGLWWLYQLQYDQARKSFSETIQANPKDPLGYFYRAGTDWWQLAQDIGREQPEIESQFEKDFKDTVRVSHASYEKSQDPKTKAAALLCEGGADGLRGRWFVAQNRWGEAYSLGKKGHKLLKRSIAEDPELIDAYLGLGIYDYYTATLPGVMGFFAKMAMGGNKKRGIEELHQAMAKAKYARVEAALFLIQINTTYEKNADLALDLARQLKNEFPHSPAMQIAEINALYETKKWKEGLLGTKDFLEKCKKDSPFFSKSNLKAGTYYAGVGALLGNQDASECLSDMNWIISEDKKPSQWVTFAYLRRGQSYDVLGKRDLARADYKMVLSLKDVWNIHKKASEALKHPFSF